MGYCKFSMPDVSGINEIKAVEKTGLGYKCGGPTYSVNVKVIVTMNFKINQQHNICKNATIQKYFVTTKQGTICSQGGHSFQASHPVKSSKDMLVSIDTIKHFLSKLGEQYSFQKKPETQHDSASSSEESVNEVVQAVMAWKNDPLTQNLAQRVAIKMTGLNCLTSVPDGCHQCHIE